MADKRWKQIERLGAAIYGEQRVALSGGNNRQANTRSDTTANSLGKWLFIEQKYGKDWLTFRRLWKGTSKLAMAEGKEPVLLLYPRHGPFLAVISAERHAALERLYLELRDRLGRGALSENAEAPLRAAILRVEEAR